jgi:hypothetical protein
MSPFEIVVVLFLTVLFIVMSVIPLLNGKTDLDSSRQSPGVKTKPAHFHR